jgi:hypothetical protein
MSGRTLFTAAAARESRAAKAQETINDIGWHLSVTGDR